MPTVSTSILQQYKDSSTTPGISKDLDLNFGIHPIKKDINKHIGEMAIINSVKNLVLTNHYERLFHPEIGSNVRKLLFENLDVITANVLEKEISQVISNFEPRVNLLAIQVKPDYDNNSFSVTMEFSVINSPKITNITFQLERLR